MNMKTAKKLLALLLAVMMTLALGVTSAFAAGNGSITIQNAAQQTTYKAYKIFDATYANDAVSYTIPDGSTIASASVPVGDDATQTAFSAIFDTTVAGGKTYVTKKSSVTDDAVVTAWLKAYLASLTNPTAAATATTAEGATTATLSGLDSGYYFVTTSQGTAVSIDTVAPNATVYDKTEVTPNVPTGTNEKEIVVGSETTTVTTADVGSTVNFKVNFSAINYIVEENETSGEIETTQITKYTVTDTPSGFSIDNTSVKVKVGDEELASTAYSVNKDNTTGKLTVTIPWVDSSNNSIYDSPSTVAVTYTATLNAGTNGLSTNEAEIKYTTGSGNDEKDTPIPDPGDEDDPDTKIYNYTVSIDKQDGTDDTKKLSGAKFVLYKTVDGTNYYYKATTDGNGTLTKVEWVSISDGNTLSSLISAGSITEVTTNDSGAASFAGLAAGEYKLVETEAPAGYNLLGSPETVTLATIGETTTNITTTQEVDVDNNKGTTMPATGGIGTTIFYVVGGVLVVAAGVLLVTKKRAGKE